MSGAPSYETLDRLRPLEPTSEISASVVREHLERTPRQLPSRYLYDELGSALFESICRLPWYPIPRAETALLARHAGAIFEGLNPAVEVTELGCGDGQKLALLLDSAARAATRIRLVDISAAALRSARANLREAGRESVETIRARYEEGLALALGMRSRARAQVVLFLGSSIGNFEPEEMRRFLRRVRALLRAGDALLVGGDLVKPEPELIRAYDDPLGVSAAFDLNVLRRINDELHATFDLSRFQHRALWNARMRRMEMHLVSRVRQEVTLPAAALRFELAQGESIRTECSYKYRPGQLAREARTCGFRAQREWVHSTLGFALTRCDV
jgi:dimethylhistidine N-methyltransferase